MRAVLAVPGDCRVQTGTSGSLRGTGTRAALAARGQP